MGFEVPQWDMESFQKQDIGNFRGHTISQYQLADARPVPGFEQPIVFDVWYGKPNRPTLIAHPVVGSKHNEIAKMFVKAFCLLGWNAVIVHRAAHPLESNNLEEFESLLQNIVNNDVQIFQFLQHHDLMQPETTISMGASLGGVSNALIATTIPYKGFFCIVSGGPIAEVICKMEHPMASAWRERIMQSMGLESVEQLQAEMEKVVRTCPVRLAKPKTPMLFFSAMFDKVVASATQKRLWKAYDGKQNYRFPSSHAGIALFIPVIIPIAVAWSLGTIKRKQ